MRLFLFLSVLLAAQGSFAGNRIAVIATLFDPETHSSDVGFMSGLREWRLEGLSPDTTVISIQASSVPELREKLAWAVRDAFGPVVGRFAPGARALFTGCNRVIPTEDREEIREAMGLTARALGLHSGALYLNSNAGSDAVEQFFLARPMASAETEAPRSAG